MSPEGFVADVVSKAFPGSTVKIWREEDRQAFTFEFRLEGEKTWTLRQTFWDEDVTAKPHAVAREFAMKIRHHMEAEMNEMDSAQRVNINVKMTTGTNSTNNYGYNYTPGMGSDGWYDTDLRRRDGARLLEVMRADKERKDEEAAKQSILDSLARKTRKQIEQGR